MSMYGKRPVDVGPDGKKRPLLRPFQAAIGGESLARQSFSNECDINEILRRSAESGMIGHLNDQTPVYADVTEYPDLQRALNVVRDSEERFMRLSAEVRERFGNDPVKLLNFLSKSENQAEAVKLGLVLPAVVPAEPKPAAPAREPEELEEPEVPRSKERKPKK